MIQSDSRTDGEMLMNDIVIDWVNRLRLNCRCVLDSEN